MSRNSGSDLKRFLTLADMLTMRSGRYVLITLLAGAASTAWELSPELAPTQFGHRGWTTADGLPGGFHPRD